MARRVRPEFKPGFPTAAEILAVCDEIRRKEDNPAREILARSLKPADWEPPQLTEGEKVALVEVVKTPEFKSAIEHVGMTKPKSRVFTEEEFKRRIALLQSQRAKLQGKAS